MEDSASKSPVAIKVISVLLILAFLGTGIALCILGTNEKKIRTDPTCYYDTAGFEDSSNSSCKTLTTDSADDVDNVPEKVAIAKFKESDFTFMDWIPNADPRGRIASKRHEMHPKYIHKPDHRPSNPIGKDPPKPDHRPSKPDSRPSRPDGNHPEYLHKPSSKPTNPYGPQPWMPAAIGKAQFYSRTATDCKNYMDTEDTNNTGTITMCHSHITINESYVISGSILIGLGVVLRVRRLVA